MQNKPQAQIISFGLIPLLAHVNLMLQPEGNYPYTNAHFTQSTIYSTVKSPSLDVSTKLISTVLIDYAFFMSPYA
jgi:hypothetical protein